MKRLLYITILLGCFSGLKVTDLFSYNYEEGWDGSDIRWANTPSMYARDVSFPLGHDARSALMEVVNKFNRNPSNMSIYLYLDDIAAGRNNSQSEIWFSSSTSDAPAITYSRWSGSTLGIFDMRLDEADIAVYVNEGWTFSRNPAANRRYGGGLRTFRTTLIHEIGHFCGLKHVSNLYNIMGTDFTFIHRNGNQNTEYFGEDATNGLIYLYGAKSGYEDLSITHWKYAGYSSGEYSVHDRSVIKDLSNVVIPAHHYNGNSEPRYEVRAGETIKPQFTVENNGYTSPLNVAVDYYLSTDNNITMEDRLIRYGVNVSLTRDVPDSLVASVTIPSDVPSGDYFLGAIVDDHHVVDEYDESNNATYIAIRVTNNIPPTPTDTPIPTDTPVPVPTPTFLPKYTPTPTPGKKPPFSFENIFVLNPVLELQAGNFTQSTTLLKQTLNVTYTDGMKEPFLADYQIGMGSTMESAQSISLSDGSLLVAARKKGAVVPTICAVLADGEIVEFANIQIPEIQVDGVTMITSMVTLMSFSYDGTDRVNLLLKAMGSDENLSQYFDVVLRADIVGPFKNTGLWDYNLH